MKLPLFLMLLACTAMPALADCAKPRTTDEYLACSRAGKIKQPKPRALNCDKPRTTDEYAACVSAGKKQ